MHALSAISLSLYTQQQRSQFSHEPIFDDSIYADLRKVSWYIITEHGSRNSISIHIYMYIPDTYMHVLTCRSLLILAGKIFIS